MGQRFAEVCAYGVRNHRTGDQEWLTSGMVMLYLETPRYERQARFVFDGLTMPRSRNFGHSLASKPAN